MYGDAKGGSYKVDIYLLDGDHNQASSLRAEATILAVGSGEFVSDGPEEEVYSIDFDSQPSLAAGDKYTAVMNIFGPQGQYGSDGQGSVTEEKSGVTFTFEKV
jgi:hypothetical protein